MTCRWKRLVFIMTTNMKDLPREIILLVEMKS
jgi:hypothetical protein